MPGVGVRVASPGSRSTPRIEPSSSSAAALAARIDSSDERNSDASTGIPSRASRWAATPDCTLIVAIAWATESWRSWASRSRSVARTWSWWWAARSRSAAARSPRAARA